MGEGTTGPPHPVNAVTARKDKRTAVHSWMIARLSRVAGGERRGAVAGLLPRAEGSLDRFFTQFELASIISPLLRVERAW